MRRTAWGGEGKPGTDEEARRRLVEATQRCIERRGVEHTSLADVAAEAGVTRQTVYRYFENGQALIHGALVLAEGGIVDRFVSHVAKWDDPSDRILETFLFLHREIPKDPYLRSVFVRTETGQKADPLFESGLAVDTGVRALRQVTGDALRVSDAELKGLVEILLRILKSLLSDPGPGQRTDDDLRQLLRRWVFVGLSTPSGTKRRTKRRP
jgi:AcrR family transcriptional regulator